MDVAVVITEQRPDRYEGNLGRQEQTAQLWPELRIGLVCSGDSGTTGMVQHSVPTEWWWAQLRLLLIVDFDSECPGDTVVGFEEGSVVRLGFGCSEWKFVWKRHSVRVGKGRNLEKQWGSVDKGQQERTAEFEVGCQSGFVRAV